MNKLTEEDGKKLLDFLKYLKRLNWILDIRYNFNDLSIIIDWHNKITGLENSYCDMEGEMQFCRMTQDLVNYFKEDVKIIETRRCKKCRKNLEKSEFFNKQHCKKCYKSLTRPKY